MFRLEKNTSITQPHLLSSLSHWCFRYHNKYTNLLDTCQIHFKLFCRVWQEFYSWLLGVLILTMRSITALPMSSTTWSLASSSSSPSSMWSSAPSTFSPQHQDLWSESTKYMHTCKSSQYYSTNKISIPIKYAFILLVIFRYCINFYLSFSIYPQIDSLGSHRSNTKCECLLETNTSK